RLPGAGAVHREPLQGRRHHKERMIMAFELERVLYETEDFLRRSLGGASAAREAKKRKAKRAFEEAMRRVRRAGFLFVGIVAALIAWSLFVAPIGLLTWIVALPTAL